MNNKESLISIIIPVYNEEISISNILKNFYDQKKKLKLELIIINDGSTDGTTNILKANNHLFDNLINLDKNYGKGKAIIEGIKLAQGEFIYFQDADLEYPADNLFLLIEAHKKSNAELIVGSRFLANQSSVIYFWHKIGNKLITFLFNLLNNKTFTDIYCCNILFKRKLLNIKKLKSYRWGQQAEILTYLSKNSKKSIEVGVYYYARKFSEGKKIKYYNIFEVIYWIIVTRLKV